MAEDLVAFAPARCLQHQLLSPGSPARHDVATTLFVDLAGFTPLTERLAHVGSRGTEELSVVLRSFFGAVTDVVLQQGGDPVAFGGDALTIVFDGPAARTRAAAAKSANAILELAEATTGTTTSAGPVQLRAKIGIARGPVTTAVAWSTQRCTPVYLGAGLDLAVAAEEAAAPGHVVMHPVLAGGPGSSCDDESTSVRPRDVQAPYDSHPLLAGLVHPIVRSRLEIGADLLESHRNVTVAFAHFPAVDQNALPSFLETVGALLELTDAADGEVVQVSGGDKGVVAMLVFGAPVAHEDNAQRAVETLLELRRLEPAAAAGVATGPVFTGLVGTAERRFPANSGPAVNLAARLMQRASAGEIVVESATWRATAVHLRAEQGADRVTVKGRAEPVDVRSVAGWRRARRRSGAVMDGPFVGRRHELAVVEQLLDDLQAGHGRQLVVEGEPGLGKTRLVSQVHEKATTRGLGVLVVDAQDHPRGQTHLLWRDILGGLLGIPRRAGRDRWTGALTGLLPDAGEGMGALGRLIGLRSPDRGSPPDIPMDIEAEIAQELFVRAVRAIPLQTPHVLVVENVHLLGDAERRVLAHLVRTLPGSAVAILVTQRRPPSPTHQQPGTHVLHLDELSAAEAALLAQDTWARCHAGTAPEWLRDAVVSRAGGNPLFVRLVTTWLYTRWEPGEPPPPDDFAAEPVTSLLRERLDRLPAMPRLLLNLLAVARRECTTELVTSALPDQFDHKTAMRSAEQLAAAALLEIELDDAGQRYRLPHELLRAELYQSMSHVRRDELHRRIAQYLVDSGADAVEIAEHIEQHTQLDIDMARRWFSLAAESARASWAVPEAIKWWQRARPLLSGAQADVARVELAELLLIGSRPSEVLAMMGPDVEAPAAAPLAARWRHAEAEAAFGCGSLDRSEAATLQVLGLTSEVDELRHQRAAELLVRVLSERGECSRAIAAAEKHLARAQRSGDTRAVTTARASLGAALLIAGLPADAAEHYEAARHGAVAAGNVVQEVHILSDLAGCEYESGDRPTCVQLLSAARVAADRIGYRRHLAVNLTNEAELRSSVGDPYATACAAAAVRRSLDLGDLGTAASAVHTWITADTELSKSPRSWRRLTAVDSQLGRRAMVAMDAAELAVAEARCGHRARSRRAADEAATIGQLLDLPHVLRRVRMARLLVSAGTVDADSLVTDLASLAEDDACDDLERAEIAVERWRISRRSAHREEAAAMLAVALASQPTAAVRAWTRELEVALPPHTVALPPPVGIGRSITTRRQLSDALALLEAAMPAGPTAQKDPQATANHY